MILQLKWTHQFQFSGYYAALEKGYYQNEVLHVEMREGGPEMNPVESLKQGRAHYGIDGSDLLLKQSKDFPLLILHRFFSTPPIC